MINIRPEWETNIFESEQQFQAKCIYWISQLFPRLRGKVWHTSNEINYGIKLPGESEEQWRLRINSDEFKQWAAIQGNKRKAEGVIAGVMDILFRQNGIIYCIELKLPGGKLSPAQKDLHWMWTNDCPRIAPVVCYTIAEVIRYIQRVQNNNLKINFPN